MPAISGLIFDIRKYSVQDGPGIRTTIFFKGCPLRCAWCHNPESQSPRLEIMIRAGRCIGCCECQHICPELAIQPNNGIPRLDRQHCTLCGECTRVCYSGALEMVGREMLVEEVMASIERDLPFYEQSGGGVTFSGGEPLLNSTFLLALLRACKDKELHTTLDTCGFAPWLVLEAVYPYIDLFLYDLKLIDDERHREYTGVSNKLILENLRRLSELRREIKVRVPIIPGITDEVHNLKGLADYIASLPNPHPVDLLPYHASATAKYTGLDKPYRVLSRQAPAEGWMRQAAQVFEAAGIRVTISGSLQE